MIAATGLRGFATIRTRPGQPSAIHHDARHCEHCGKRLSRYTQGTLCMACEDAEITATVNREIALAMAKAEAKTRIPTDALAVTLPRDHRGYVDWSRLVSTFLQGTEPVVALVDSQGVNAMRTGARKAIARLGVTDCYVSVREGRCYLLRGGAS